LFFSGVLFAKSASSLGVFTETESAIVYKYVVEKEQSVISGDRISNKGLGSPIKSLETFLYFSKQGDYKNAINMHYEEDGSKRYVKESLYKNRQFFTGVKNLSLIDKISTLKVGMYRVMTYQLTNKKGQKVPWSDYFVCKKNTCKKSFLDMFGNADSINQISYFIRYQHLLKKAPNTLDTSKYQKIKISSDFYGEGPDLELLLKVQRIDKAIQKDRWYVLLNKINEIKHKYHNQEKLSEVLNEYMVEIFRNWSENKYIGFRFSPVRIEKHWLVNNISVVKDFQIDSYVDTGKLIWIFAKSKSPDDSSSKFVFLYERSTGKFIMNPYKERGGGAILSPSVEKSIFPNLPDNAIDNSKGSDLYIYKPEIDRQLLNSFLKSIK
jgi:hypothetical protein